MTKSHNKNTAKPRLTKEQQDEIVALSARGYSDVEIAGKTARHRNTIRNVLDRFLPDRAQDRRMAKAKPLRDKAIPPSPSPVAVTGSTRPASPPASPGHHDTRNRVDVGVLPMGMASPSQSPSVPKHPTTFVAPAGTIAASATPPAVPAPEPAVPPSALPPTGGSVPVTSDGLTAELRTGLRVLLLHMKKAKCPKCERKVSYLATMPNLIWNGDPIGYWLRCDNCLGAFAIAMAGFDEKFDEYGAQHGLK
jgi:hypothetical protein